MGLTEELKKLFVAFKPPPFLVSTVLCLCSTGSFRLFNILLTFSMDSVLTDLGVKSSEVELAVWRLNSSSFLLKVGPFLFLSCSCSRPLLDCDCSPLKTPIVHLFISLSSGEKKLVLLLLPSWVLERSGRDFGVEKSFPRAAPLDLWWGSGLGSGW